MPSLEEVVNVLESRQWWRATPRQIRKHILGLPDKYLGFKWHLAYIQDTARLPTHPDDLFYCLRLKHFFRAPKSSSLVVFEVRIGEHGHPFTWEYTLKKNGPHNGGRGILLLTTRGKITHFGLLHTFRFPVNGTVLDTIGGGRKWDESELTGFLRELREETGLEKYQRLVSLGQLWTDFTITPSHPPLFAVVARLSDLPDCHTNLDSHESSRLQIFPIEQLFRVISRSDDSHILAILSRLLVSDVFQPSELFALLEIARGAKQ